MGVTLDHLEVHVVDIERYCRFLVSIFEGGSFEAISPSGTSMFTNPEGIRIEVKKRKTDVMPSDSGFCNPCIRRSSPLEFIESLGLKVERERSSPEGMVFFFFDHEGVLWHIKPPMPS
jgi:hypothetical protein